MDRLVALIASAPQTRSANDDDFVDRLSSRYSVVILVVFSILVSMNQYVRNPITCWAPVHFTGAHTKFTTSYCWIKNTYYLPWENEVPRPWEDNKRIMIPYYQWIPFILLAQALFFYIPTVIWHGLNQRAGVDADNILAAAHTFARIDKVDDQEKTLRLLRNQLDRFLSSPRGGGIGGERRVRRGCGCQCNAKTILSSTCCRLCGARLGNYLVVLFLFSKICYIANVIGQLFLLNAVLSTKYNTFGLDMVKNMIDSGDQRWTEDSYVAFPRVTYCDFQIRGQDLANVQRYTVQCVLPINLYNEKIYMFLWFWMAFVASASILSFIVWLFRSISAADRLKFITNHLMLGNRLHPANQHRRMEVVDGKVTHSRSVRNFTEQYLRQDGAFLLRLIAHNSNNIVVTEVVCAVWDFWKERAVNASSVEEEEEEGEEEGEGHNEKALTMPSSGKS